MRTRGADRADLRADQLAAEQVRVRPQGGDGQPTTQTAFLQLVLLSSLVGVGRAAVRDAVGFVRSRTRVYSQGSGATAAQDPLVGPGGAVDDGDRHLLAQERHELPHHAGEIVDRKMDAQGGTRGGEGREALAFRHGRGAHGRAGEDDRLGNIGKRELAAERCRSGGEGRNPGGDRPGYARGLEAADLLGDGAVERGVARMDAGDVEACGMGGLDLGQDFVEVHGCGVEHPGTGRRFGHDLGRDQGAGVEADRTAADQGEPAHGDEVGRTRAGADEVDRHRTS